VPAAAASPPAARPAAPPLHPAAGAAASYLALPHKAGIVSGGPEAGVFGLACLATVFSRLAWSWPRLLELLCLAPFVVHTVAATDASLAPLMQWNRSRVGHYVPMAGGMAGAALVAAVCAVVRRYRQQKQKQQRGGGVDAAAVLEDPLVNAMGKVAGFIIRKVI
jgi:hypothetical protein